ncbi:MraY family glycosyltransferase [Agrobacterium fabrum]|uniref:MraY family glycosyltransferase n=1 Tax=Agrobacterium fabrum TaxID=1176649 RepID=UPI00088F31F0|nr:MraY family glycosyltransferase [Agrobacterium fabrum]WCK77943.1 MraY family glycosyltransferase [Agrobacterium fabrum]SDB70354.1 UDP-GlcNAc:undecaprenyl-phosphate GlcNAc-1-phosphate transferase [Agrobacterium fabrum]SES18549.1 UDP-GlcNAc:undecaprenyl-phosphate GlcNAc-1-phosphate transferase [Agrobacterium fabrum]
MSGILFNTIATFVLCVSFIVVLRRLTIAFQLVDRPDSIRKRHTGAVPLCGGIAIFAAFAVSAFVGGWSGALGINFWLGLAVILLMGVVDDRRPLPAAGRLVMQLAMAIALVGGADIGSLSVGVLFTSHSELFLPLFFFIGVLFVTGLVNSWNMLDGVDGLAGGTAGVALIWLMIVAVFANVGDIIPPLEALSVCLCAFLVFNMRGPWRARASIFLGDAGSTALGATIAYVIVLLATRSVSVSFPALLWIVILPITDTLSLIIRRIMHGRSPMSADRWHFHHLLLDYGFTPAAATNTLIVISFLCGGIGFAGIKAGVPAEVMAAGLLLPIALHTAFVLAATGYLSKTLLHRGNFDLYREVVRLPVVAKSVSEPRAIQSPNEE